MKNGAVPGVRQHATGARPRARMRPTRVRAAGVLLLVAVAIFGIARTTGAGWLIVILSGLAAVAVASAVWPALALGPVTVSVRSPRDAVAGHPVSVDLTVTGGRHGVQVRVSQPASDWQAADPPVSGPVSIVPSRRGVIREMAVEVRSGAPLGLVWWRKVFHVPLTMPMEVGPTLVVQSFPSTTPAGSIGESRPRGRSGADTVRSLRDYVPGDATRLIHWAATARHGELIVKELEGPDSPRLALIVDLRCGAIDPNGPAAIAEGDETAGRAVGLIRAGLQAGVPIVLLTVEEGGDRVAPVTSPTDANRRLARAVAGPPPDGPIDAGMTVITLETPSRLRQKALS